jgi:sulfur carrier protein
VIRVNGVEEQFLNETVSELVRRRSIEPRGIAVAINGDVVRRSDWEMTPIPDGASIEIVTAAAGG